MTAKLTFLGASQNVTGSCYLLEANGTRILVDCVMFQERQFQSRNWDPFPARPGKIDAVLLTHAHLDHCGLLPKLVKEGFRGKVYATAATAEIAKIVLLDSARLQEEDVQFKRRRHQKEGRKGAFPEMPLYDVQDVQRCCKLFKRVEYNDPRDLKGGLRATFYNAGHILGAAMIKVAVDVDGQKRTILFSGDVGRQNMPILDDPAVLDRADYLLVESTYGDKTHMDQRDTQEKMAEVINAANAAGGNIVIPIFAVERSQEVLYRLHEMRLADRIPNLMVFLDSPMAISVTEVFESHPELFDKQTNTFFGHVGSPFQFQGLTFTRTVNESKAINNIKGTVIIIAGSGMCTGGRIKHHLANNIGRPECTILFLGYQAVGTLGRLIVDGAGEVRIFGQILQVRAKVVTVDGFSAHADRNELMAWLSGMKAPPRKIFVVHGEAESARHLAEHIGQEKGWPTAVPAYLEQVELD